MFRAYRNLTNDVGNPVLNMVSCGKVRAIGAYLSVFCVSCVRKFPETQLNIMKKLMFTLALSALVTMGVQAQKQMGDEHNIEVAFTPFGGSPIDGSTLKYRNFLEDNRAFRLSLTMSNSNDLHAWYQDGEINEADPVSPQLNINTKGSAYGIALGYELHFDGRIISLHTSLSNCHSPLAHVPTHRSFGGQKTSMMQGSLTNTSSGT